MGLNGGFSIVPSYKRFIRRLPERGFFMSESSDIIIGRNPVTEAIRAGRTIDKLYIKKGDATVMRLAALAREHHIPVSYVTVEKLNAMCAGNHQGVIAKAAVKDYSTVEDLLSYAKERGEAPFLLICDRITDPHNLGAIIRNANAAGCHGVIIARHEAVGLSAVVDKASAGALDHTRVAKVSNIGNTLNELKKAGLWVAGAAMGGQSMYEADLTGPLALVIGNEGDGLARLVCEKCDFLLSIPMFGQTESLNASCAAAVLLYESVRQRTLAIIDKK